MGVNDGFERTEREAVAASSFITGLIVEHYFPAEPEGMCEKSSRTADLQNQIRKRELSNMRHKN
jgi:hypothetical protein